MRSYKQALSDYMKYLKLSYYNIEFIIVNKKTKILLKTKSYLEWKK